MTYLRNQTFDEKDFPAFTAIREQFGFLPNFFPAQTLRPDLIDAEINLMASILLKEGALARRQKEYIFLVCSAANLSTYCVTAHCEIIRMLHLEGPEPEQVAIDHASTKLPLAMKALLNFACKLNAQPRKVSGRDVQVLRTFGYTDEHIIEAIAMVG